MQRHGLGLISNPLASTADYQKAFKRFFEGTPDFRLSSYSQVAGCAYKQLFLRKKILVSVNQNFDSVKHCPDSNSRLARAILRTLPLILPKELTVTSSLAHMLTREIVGSISQEIDADNIWNCILEQAGR